MLYSRTRPFNGCTLCRHELYPPRPGTRENPATPEQKVAWEQAKNDFLATLEEPNPAEPLPAKEQAILDANQALYDPHYYDGYSEDYVRNHDGRSTMPPGHREKIRESMFMDAIEKLNQEDPDRARKILYAFQY